MKEVKNMPEFEKEYFKNSQEIIDQADRLVKIHESFYDLNNPTQKLNFETEKAQFYETRNKRLKTVGEKYIEDTKRYTEQQKQQAQIKTEPKKPTKTIEEKVPEIKIQSIVTVHDDKCYIHVPKGDNPNYKQIQNHMQGFLEFQKYGKIEGFTTQTKKGTIQTYKIQPEKTPANQLANAITQKYNAVNIPGIEKNVHPELIKENDLEIILN